MIIVMLVIVDDMVMTVVVMVVDIPKDILIGIMKKCLR